MIATGLRDRLNSAKETKCDCGHYHPVGEDKIEWPERDCGAWNCPCQVFRLNDRSE
jgi:hypothetical protein